MGERERNFPSPGVCRQWAGTQPRTICLSRVGKECALCRGLRNFEARARSLIQTELWSSETKGTNLLHYLLILHVLMSLSQFIKCASDGRSTFVGRIKHDCFRTVFGSMVPSASEQGFDAFEDPTCQQLLGYDAEKKVYTSLPPILWPDGVRGIDNRFLFRSETLMKVRSTSLYACSA